MRRLLVLTISLFVWMSGFALAQSYPTRDDPYVNDLADILFPEEEANLRALAARIAPDFDLTILTIQSTSDYDPSAPSIETFATGLFNDWGIGSPERNTGVLMLIVLDTQEIRLELGRDYGIAYNAVAQAVINESMLPRFSEGDLEGGLTDGILHLYRELTGQDLEEADSGAYPINHASGCDADACLKQKHVVSD